ncbi:2555_t:CDS:2 [Paraglomus occultum]|uniref:2555_t:CDS:1 n=1 Tax=Paraglomus occultum TaxID=144539 RepID=A0A9N8Z7U0_9GLOM|nr:2555_t:CDS:2 [Paraglomus occultum]
MSSNIFAYKYKRGIGRDREIKTLQTKTKESLSMKKVIVALDGSDHSMYALTWAMDNIIDARSDIIMLLAVGIFNQESSPLEYYAATRNILDNGPTEAIRKKTEDNANEILKRGTSIINERYAHEQKYLNLECHVRLNDDAGTTITEFAKKTDADVIVLGHRGTSTSDGDAVGSVSQYCLHSAACTVVIVRKESKVKEKMEVKPEVIL